MEHLPLGLTGQITSRVILGTNVFGWSVDEAQAFNIMDAALERGLNVFDTADIYTFWGDGNKGGESETIIGKWLKRRGKREDVVIHTKGGAPNAPGEFANANLSAQYLSKAVDASLTRLGTDYVDLYYPHYDDNVTPPEETLRVFETLLSAGKIRAIGASNFNADRLKLSLEVSDRDGLPRYVCLQTFYNLYDREVFERGLEPLILKEGLGVVTYFSLAQGFLTGKYRSIDNLGLSKVRSADVEPYLNERGYRILAALDHVAERYTSVPAEVALAWLIARPGVAAPISSATSLSQLDHLVNAANLQLDADAIAALDQASEWRTKAT
jgi:aryl-alcohol dehydrogenase-like predicted oxidoreductase